MGILAQVNIALFPLLLLVVMLWDLRSAANTSSTDKQFGVVALCVFVPLLLELATELFKFYSFPYASELTWIVMSIYLCATPIVVVAWFVYMDALLCGGRLLAKKPVKLSLNAFLIVYVLISLSSPATHLVFFVDENNQYQRGVLSFLPYVSIAVFIALTGYLALRERKKAELKERKRECTRFLTFLILPAIGTALQMINYEWRLAWPFMAVSVLLAYISIQNHQASTDTLTGLCTRRVFEQYVRKQMQDNAGSHTCLFLVDVDDFKSINDQFGHAIGDEALCNVADILRDVFSKADALIARCGGDEFIVLAVCEACENWQQGVDELDRAVRAANESGRYPYSLSLSVGHAAYNSSMGVNEGVWIDAADTGMYQRKKMRKSQSENTSVEKRATLGNKGEGAIK